MHALILTFMIVGFSPAPVAKPKPLSFEEQDALMQSAIDEMRLAQDEVDRTRKRPGDRTAAEKDFAPRNRSAAEKLTRVHEQMDKKHFLRIAIGMQAGRAWKLSGEDARAAGFFERAAKECSETTWRLESLEEARSCHVRAKQPAKAKDALGRMKAEARKLTGKDKEVWEKRISRIERP